MKGSCIVLLVIALLVATAPASASPVIGESVVSTDPPDPDNEILISEQKSCSDGGEEFPCRDMSRVSLLRPTADSLLDEFAFSEEPVTVRTDKVYVLVPRADHIVGELKPQHLELLYAEVGHPEIFARVSFADLASIEDTVFLMIIANGKIVVDIFLDTDREWGAFANHIVYVLTTGRSKYVANQPINQLPASDPEPLPLP